MQKVSQWTVFETRLQARGRYDNPFLDVDVSVTFRSPGGREVTKDAFWDGGDVWIVRFSPDEVGQWSWRSACSCADDAGLGGQEGQFQCAAYDGDNPLFKRGRIRLSDNRRHFAHADGTPFFYLADTAWNGVLNADEDDWRTYLQARREQGFSAVQFVCTQWRAMEADAGFTVAPPITLKPEFFRRMDAKVSAINEYGLLAVPVVLWANQAGDPGRTLAADDAARVARYIVARWGAHQVAWMLGGDGNYRAELADKWRAIGRQVFPEPRDRLVTMHPHGQAAFTEEFRNEHWFDFNSYQSGHGSSPRELAWLVFGPPATDWRDEPVRPGVNVEPNYEGHPDYSTRQLFTSFHVRRASYWSLLVMPTAGVTYGINPIWCWRDDTGEHPGHANIDRFGPCPPWHTALRTPGTASISILRRLFDSLAWWELRPVSEIIPRQSGHGEPAHFVASAAAEDRSWALIYAPFGGEVTVNPAPLRTPMTARWFCPRTERWVDAGTLGDELAVMKAPDTMDWILLLRKP